MEVHTSKSYCPAVTQCSCTGIKYFPVTKFPGRICCLRMWSQMWRRKRHGGLHFLSDKSFSALIAICISFHFFPLKQIRQYYQLLFICLLPLKSGGSWLPTSPPSATAFFWLTHICFVSRCCAISQLGRTSDPYSSAVSELRSWDIWLTFEVSYSVPNVRCRDNFKWAKKASVSVPELAEYGI